MLSVLLARIRPSINRNIICVIWPLLSLIVPSSSSRISLSVERRKERVKQAEMVPAAEEEKEAL